jgi:hypothetical protein
MSTNVESPEFKQKLGQLWAAIAPVTSIARVSGKIAHHEKSTFLGYVDLILGIPTVAGHVSKVQIRGIGIKILNGKPNLQMPQERGEDGKYYPTTFTQTPEDRELWTAMIFADSRVQALVEQAVREAEAAATTAAAAVGVDLEIGASVASGQGAEPEAGSVAAQVGNPFHV